MHIVASCCILTICDVISCYVIATEAWWKMSYGRGPDDMLLKSSLRSLKFDRQGKTLYRNKILVDRTYYIWILDFILVFDPVCVCVCLLVFGVCIDNSFQSTFWDSHCNNMIFWKNYLIYLGHTKPKATLFDVETTSLQCLPIITNPGTPSNDMYDSCLLPNDKKWTSPNCSSKSCAQFSVLNLVCSI